MTYVEQRTDAEELDALREMRDRHAARIAELRAAANALWALADQLDGHRTLTCACCGHTEEDHRSLDTDDTAPDLCGHIDFGGRCGCDGWTLTPPRG